MASGDVKSIAETASEEKWRMISILSYIIVLIGFGIPIWWHTTRVYRAALPLEEMLDLKSVPAIPLHLEIYSSIDERANNLIDEISVILGTTVSLSIYNRKIHLPKSDNVDDIETAAKLNIVDPGNILLAEWSNSEKEIVVSGQRTIFFRKDVTGYRLSMLLQKWPGVTIKTALSDPKLSRGSEQSLRPFPAGPKFDILVTVVNPDPQSVKIEWDLLQIMADYLKPYLAVLNNVANFTLKSQWLYFVDLGVNPRQVGNHWALAEQLLPHIITPLEKKLSSHVAKNPSINFAIYIPPCSMSPIHIYTKKGARSPGLVDAFVSPRWGGIQICNPNCTGKTFTPDSQQIMSVILTQLSQLLGLPDFENQDIFQTGVPPAMWQFDYLIRTHTQEYLESARLTLRSLAQLLSEISNIVINDEVARRVQVAVTNTKLAEKLLEEKKLMQAFKKAQIASINAENAFTDPSLLALLYFPDDQKYAVYIPLFLPIMIPVIMSILVLMKYFKELKNADEKKAKKE